MQVRNHGKYTKMNKSSPRGIARCDYSGLMVRHADLVRQMRYTGSGLVWTGYLVHPKFSDKPNPQDLFPRIKLDPVPITSARPDSQIDAQGTLASSVGVLDLDVSGNANITLTPKQFDNGEFNFKGALTGNIIIFIPNTYNQFYANNLTSGGFTLSVQITGSAFPALVIPLANPQTRRGPTLVNTLSNLQFVNF